MLPRGVIRDGLFWIVGIVLYGALALGASRSLAADCASPDGAAGQIYHDEAAGDQKRCDGSTWVSLGPVKRVDMAGVVTSGLAGYWDFDETEGAAAGAWAGAIDGTLQNGPVWKPYEGRFRGGLGFDGVDDHVIVGEASDLEISGDFSLSAWIRHSGAVEANSGGGWRILSKQASGKTYFLRIEDTEPSSYENGKASFVLGEVVSENRVSLVSTSDVNDGAWHLLSVTRSGDDFRLFVDGVEEAAAEFAWANDAVGSPLVIGALNATSENFSGLIDDVRFYGRALSAGEIQQLHSGGAGCVDPDGVAGVMVFNGGYGLMQYCDGADWVAMSPVPGAGVYAPSGAGGGAPDTVSFADVTGADVNTVVMPNSVTISGLWGGSTAVSVTGEGFPEVRINGGPWVTSGAISNGQTLEVRLTSSVSFNTALSTTVNVGGVTDSWSVTTRAANNCADQTMNWSNCDAPSGAMTHGQSKTVANTTSGYTGTRDLTCTDGTISQSGGSCDELAYTLPYDAGTALDPPDKYSGNGTSATVTFDLDSLNPGWTEAQITLTGYSTKYSRTAAPKTFWIYKGTAAAQTRSLNYSGGNERQQRDIFNYDGVHEIRLYLQSRCLVGSCGSAGGGGNVTMRIDQLN